MKLPYLPGLGYTMSTSTKYALSFAIGLPIMLFSYFLFTPTTVNALYKQPAKMGTDGTAIAPSLQLPADFKFDLFSNQVPNARFMAVTRRGDLLVSQPKLGKISLLRADDNGDGQSDAQRNLITNLNRPHGLLLHEDWLYIAESNSVSRVAFDHTDGRLAGSYETIVKGLADTGNHWTKTIGMGPDGWIYLSSGSSCNVCIEADPQRATIMRFKPDGSNLQIYATGLRNSVGFDWSPKDGALYATDNGRDWLGNDFPSCELNQIEEGRFYGWPYANGQKIPDPDFGVNADGDIAAKISNSLAPVHEFPAHNAPLGIQFLRSPQQPRDYRGAALVALHGSWNRDKKDGYKVVSLHWQKDGSIQQRDFLWGFLGANGKKVYGRPVAIGEDTNGNIYISDDHAGAIYRLSPSSGNAAVPSGRQPPAQKNDAGPANKVTIDLDAATQGEQLYQLRGCAQCHRQQVPLRNLTANYSLQQLADYFDTPTPPMPNYGFNANQKRALAHYLLNREQGSD